MEHTVAIPAEVLEPLEQAVAAGEFTSVSDALRVIVGQWQQESWTASNDAEWLRTEIAKGVNDPRPNLSADDVEIMLKNHINGHQARLDARS